VTPDFILCPSKAERRRRSTRFIPPWEDCNWSVHNRAQLVLASTLGQKGARDLIGPRAPVCAHEGREYYLVATDLSINLDGDWTRANLTGCEASLPKIMPPPNQHYE
jgi:hypothetical protein